MWRNSGCKKCMCIVYNTVVKNGKFLTFVPEVFHGGSWREVCIISSTSNWSLLMLQLLRKYKIWALSARCWLQHFWVPHHAVYWSIRKEPFLNYAIKLNWYVETFKIKACCSARLTNNSPGLRECQKFLRQRGSADQRYPMLHQPTSSSHYLPHAWFQQTQKQQIYSHFTVQFKLLNSSVKLPNKVMMKHTRWKLVYVSQPLYVSSARLGQTDSIIGENTWQMHQKDTTDHKYLMPHLLTKQLYNFV